MKNKQFMILMSFITTFLVMSVNNVYALERNIQTSDEINIIVVMALLWANIIVMIIQEIRRRKR